MERKYIAHVNGGTDYDFDIFWQDGKLIDGAGQEIPDGECELSGAEDLVEWLYQLQNGWTVDIG